MMTEAEDPIAEVLGLFATRVSDAQRGVTQLREDVICELEHRPFRTLALSAGAGYLLAGGLFSSLTLRFISFGTRLAILPMIAAAIAAARAVDDSAGRPNSRHPRSGSRLAESQT